MPSPAWDRITADIRSWPGPDGIDVDEWRRRAGGAALEPDPAGLQVEWLETGWPPPVLRARFDPDAGASDWRRTPPAWNWHGTDEPVVVWFHGGGFVVCSASTHRVPAARVAATVDGSAVLPEYRLAPETPFPGAVDDGVQFLRRLWARGVDPARTVVAGDSAGGNLALTVPLVLRDAGDPLPAAIVAVSPWTDLTLSGASLVANRERDPFAHLDDLPRMRDLYLQGADPRSPLASPLFADLGGLPPILVVVGDTETMLDDSVRLRDAVHAADGQARLEVVLDGFHTWLNYAGELPEADEAVDRIGHFLRDHLRCE